MRLYVPHILANTMTLGQSYVKDESLIVRMFVANAQNDRNATDFQSHIYQTYLWTNKHKYAMTEHIKMNYKGNPSYARTLWKCNHCSNQDSESHILWCSEYEDLRKDLDLGKDSDLCSYLQKIFKLRSDESTK